MRRVGGGRILAGVLVLLLAACATIAPQPSATDEATGHGPIKTVAFSGRIAVRQPSGSDTGKIEWVDEKVRQHIELLTPLGSTVASITQTQGLVRVVLSDSREYSASDAEQLTRQVLGYPLPLEGLSWWIRGEPAPTGPAEVRRGNNGLPQSISQDGWKLDYAEWRPVGERFLPGRMRLQQGHLDIRLVIDRWQLEGQNP
jgi:outer membrane lipoprotein LolB